MNRSLTDSFDFNFGTNTTRLHPAADLDVGEVLSSTIFNVIIFAFMMLSYEYLRRKYPSVYASRQRRETELRRKGGRPVFAKESSYYNHPPSTQSSQSSDVDLPDIYEDLIPMKWLGHVYSVSWSKVQEVSISYKRPDALSSYSDLIYIYTFKDGRIGRLLLSTIYPNVHLHHKCLSIIRSTNFISGLCLGKQ